MPATIPTTRLVLETMFEVLKELSIRFFFIILCAIGAAFTVKAFMMMF